MCELTGFSERELLGCSPPLPVLAAESEGASRAISDEVIARRPAASIDVVLCRKSGERFPAIVTVGVTSGGAIRGS